MRWNLFSIMNGKIILWIPLSTICEAMWTILASFLLWCLALWFLFLFYVLLKGVSSYILPCLNIMGSLDDSKSTILKETNRTLFIKPKWKTTLLGMIDGTLLIVLEIMAKIGTHIVGNFRAFLFKERKSILDWRSNYKRWFYSIKISFWGIIDRAKV